MNAQIDDKDSYDQSPLHHAIKNNNIEVVKLLLNRRACVDASDRDGMTPLHLASKKNCPEIVEILLEYGANVNQTIHTTATQNIRKGYTPLHYAVERGSLEVTELLLKYNADVNITAGCGTPLHLASVKGITKVARLLLKNRADIDAVADGNFLPLYLATKAAHKNTVKLLLEHGANVDAPNGNDNKTALCCAVENRHQYIIKEILKFRPDVNNESNKSSLKHAIKTREAKYKNIVAYLLEYGFRVGPEDINDCILLHSAVECGYLMIVRDLLCHGADANMVNDKTDDKTTALHYAAIKGGVEIAGMLLVRNAQIDAEDSNGRTSLHHAIENNRVQVVKLLLNRRASVNASDRDGMTPLHLASKENHLKIVQILLNYGAYVNPTICATPTQNVPEGYTPLHYAVERGSLEVTKLLLQYNAKVNIMAGCRSTLCFDVKTRFSDILYERDSVNSECSSIGYTPLHLACVEGNMKVVKLLLMKGADINAVAKGNFLPLYIATKAGHTKIVKLLLEEKADVDAPNGNDNKTALCCAAEKGYLYVIEEILKFRPDVNNKSNKSSLKCALRSAGPKKNKIVENLLKYGFRVSPEDINNCWLLYSAAKHGHLTIVRDLLRYGADVNMVNDERDDKTTALHAAADKGHAEVVKMLLQNGATVNSKARNDKTPLHFAALRGIRKIVEILIQFGAEVNLMDGFGRTALYNACTSGKKFLITLLLQNGSDINIGDRCPFNKIFYPFSGPDVPPDHVGMENAKIIVRHVAKLKAENLFVNETTLQAIMTTPGLEQHYFDCEKEITEMKNRRIPNTRLSFCDFFLIKDIHQLKIYSNNENIIEVFESTEYSKVFPIYADDLENQFKKGQERECLLKSSLSPCNSLFRNKLPYFCMNRMFSYLSNLDLRNFIYALSCDVSDEN